LYLAKTYFEERVKNALQYNLAYESPLFYVQRFFANTFTLQQLCEEPIARWRREAELIITNTSFIPLSLWFHPVHLAAAYLAWTRAFILEKSSELKPSLPEHLHGHPWYLFVDAGITLEDLSAVWDALAVEIKFVFKMVSGQ